MLNASKRFCADVDGAMTDLQDALRDFAAAELALQQEKYQTRATRFRIAAAEAHATWRIGCIPPRWGNSVIFIFREGICDIVRMRLCIAFMPLFQGLERIERRFGIIADLKREPWASPEHPVNQPHERQFRKSSQLRIASYP
jgi:hypothetical protein